jgi:alkanesulfonate monooxygenase SsuD/methylene tetrahydromethanopterin reductase-like flavin-dependent oxidoreductase (luciferase family)
MKLGLFMMPLHPPEKSRTQCFEEDIELVVLADELGLSEAWIGQHHSVAWEPIPANDLFIATVLPRTQQIRLGTGVTIVPQHHPVNIAVRLAYLDHLSHGRINCGFGQGGVTTDWGLFDLPDAKTQGLMTVEGIDMVLKLWQLDPPFDLQGQFWHIKLTEPKPERGIGTLLKPYQQPHPPIAMSIVRGKSMAARMAGQRGYLPISTNLVPNATLLEHWQTYCAGVAEAGKDTPDRSIWRISRSILIGETTEAAWEHARNGSFIRSFAYLIDVLQASNMLSLVKHDPAVPDVDVTPEYMLNHLCIIGDAAECIRQLNGLWEQTGGFGTLLMIAHDWDDKERWRYSTECLAREVIPALPTLELV